MTKHTVLIIGVWLIGTTPALLRADSFSISTFATGTAIGATQPDSVSFGDNSLWIAYTNGAASDGSSGSSTVVQYSLNRSITNKWTITGNVDGLRVAPDGTIWALQNNDANAAVTLINPTTKATSTLSWGSSYTANNNAATRGFDDIAFRGSQTFLSETNPASGADPTVLKLSSPVSSPLQVSPIANSTITGTNMATGKQGSTTITDPDSLILAPNGDLVLTGEADQTMVWIHNPGATNQNESYLPLQGVNGNPDDSVFPTSSAGTFYVADTGANKVYAISATGIAANQTFLSVGTEFGLLNTSTGDVTSILEGTSPHGAEFVPAVTGVPEPSCYAMLLGGLLTMAGVVYRRRIRKQA
jgi:hypothetical protein